MVAADINNILKSFFTHKYEYNASSQLLNFHLHFPYMQSQNN